MISDEPQQIEPDDRNIEELLGNVIDPLVIPRNLIRAVGDIHAAATLIAVMKWIADTPADMPSLDQGGFLWVAPAETDWENGCVGGERHTGAIKLLKSKNFLKTHVFVASAATDTDPDTPKESSEKKVFYTVLPAVINAAIASPLPKPESMPGKKTRSPISDTGNDTLSLANLGINPHPEDQQRLEECLQIAQMFAKLLVANGSKPAPKITRTWVEDIDKMVRIDGHSMDSIRKSIFWAQANSFWWVNVKSPKKLREKFEMLRKQAAENPQKARTLIEQSQNVLREGKNFSSTSTEFGAINQESSEDETRRMAESLGMVWNEEQQRWMQPRPNRQ